MEISPFSPFVWSIAHCTKSFVTRWVVQKVSRKFPDTGITVIFCDEQWEVHTRRFECFAVHVAISTLSERTCKSYKDYNIGCLIIHDGGLNRSYQSKTFFENLSNPQFFEKVKNLTWITNNINWENDFNEKYFVLFCDWYLNFKVFINIFLKILFIFQN